MYTYKDKWGYEWVRLGIFYVKRLKDNNIGLWDKGKGLNYIGWKNFLS